MSQTLVKSFYATEVRYEWRRLVQDAYHSLELLTTLRYLEKYLPKEGHILDAGGGPGRYTMELAQRGYQVTLLDLTPENVAFAGRMIQRRGLEAARQGSGRLDHRPVALSRRHLRRGGLYWRPDFAYFGCGAARHGDPGTATRSQTGRAGVHLGDEPPERAGGGADDVPERAGDAASPPHARHGRLSRRHRASPPATSSCRRSCAQRWKRRVRRSWRWSGWKDLARTTARASTSWRRTRYAGRNGWRRTSRPARTRRWWA